MSLKQNKLYSFNKKNKIDFSTFTAKDHKCDPYLILRNTRGLKEVVKF